MKGLVLQTQEQDCQCYVLSRIWSGTSQRQIQQLRNVGISRRRGGELLEQGYEDTRGWAEEKPAGKKGKCVGDNAG